MSAYTRSGRVKRGRKIPTSGAKRLSSRSSRTHGGDDAVKTLRKEMEALRLELARLPNVARVNESSWQVANDSPTPTQQTFCENSRRLVSSGAVDVSVGQEERTADQCVSRTGRPGVLLAEAVTAVDEDWISQARQKNAAKGAGHCFPSVDPVQCIEPFDGDPRKWDLFIGSFRALVHDVMPSDAIRMAYLRRLLSPQVRDSISTYLHNPELYREALKDLKYRYGDRRLIAQYSLKALRGMEPLRREDLKELDRFSCELHGIISSLVKSGHQAEMVSAGNLHDVVAKLTPRLREKWTEKARCLPCPVSLQLLDDWLCEVVLTKRSAAIFDESTMFKPAASRQKKAAGVNVIVKDRTLSAVCAACNRSHPLTQCEQFNSMTLDDRLKVARKAKCCFVCLSVGHQSRACNVQKSCPISGCSRKHHRLLHGASFRQNVDSTQPISREQQELREGSKVVQVGATISDRAILLLVVPIMVRSSSATLSTYALLDSGSEASLITEDLAKKLGLNLKPTAVCLTTFKDRQPIPTLAVSFEVASCDGSYVLQVREAFTVNRLNLSHRKIAAPAAKATWPHVADVPLNDVNCSEVQVLLGIDYFEVHRQLEIRSPARQGQPYAVRGPLGWMLAGPIQRTSNKNLAARQVNKVGLSELDTPCVETLLERFWSTESFGTKPNVRLRRPVEIERSEAILKTSTRKRGSRYEVGLLWKNLNPELPNNRPQALGRLAALQRRLFADAKLEEAYRSAINDLIRNGIAKRLTVSEIESPAGRIWYLPHHGVRHPMKPDKLRVVFDASATYDNASLNSLLSKGPPLLNDLCGLLIRFRRYKIPVSADIDRMFHQVDVPENDQSVLRFLWRNSLCEPIGTYQMTRQVFGLTSAPASCIHAMNKCLYDSGNESMAKRAVTQFYVDNYLDSFFNAREAAEFIGSLKTALLDGGFPLSKWASTSREVLSTLSVSQLSAAAVNLNLGNSSEEGILGLEWNCESDTLSFRIGKVVANVRTRRQLVSAVARLFDPLGIAAPVMLEAKLIVRTAVNETRDWDSELQKTLIRRYHRWSNSLLSLKAVKIDRWLGISAMTDHLQLHIFADASSQAFGAVGYLRVLNGNGVNVSIVMARSRLAPKRPLSIPRMELQAAVMAVRMGSAIVNELKVSLNAVMYWTDSTTVLQWIASKTMAFPVFVANRIAEILDESEPKQWRYVPGSLNPADDLSRGLRVEELRKEHRWFSGPPFLKMDEIDWPPPKGTREESEGDNLEQCVTVIVREDNPLNKLFERKSSLKSILRIVAYVWRFGARSGTMERNGPLKADELKTARLICMRSEQRVYFGQEIEALSRSGQVSVRSRLAPLRPYLDAQRLMRVGGRLRRTELPEGTQHPVIMSPRSTMLHRMIWERHLELMHAGSERVLADLRTEVWVISGRRCVRGVLKNCLYCQRLTVKPVFPRMADLPLERIDFKHPAFSNVGIDFFGPLEVSVKRSRVKRYGLIFTCLTTRAAHLEVTYTMDVHSFIGALRRFIARRGCPSTIVSDNAKTFVGTNALQQKEQLERFLADRYINWKFNPPGGPHHGGAWERLIAVAKKALSATLRGNIVDDETMLTVFAEVEALLNGRPLTYLTDDPDCVEPLTPFHLLIGRQNAQVPSDVTDNRTSLRRHWKTAQSIVNRFWKRWLREYLPTLQRRDKWWNDTANLRAEDFVLVVEPTVKRGEWLTGRVVRVIDSPDGIIRKAIVKTKFGQYERPVTRLALLEADKA